MADPYYDDRRGSYRSDDRDRRAPPYGSSGRRDDYYDDRRSSRYDEPRRGGYRDEPPRRDDYRGGGRDDYRHGGGRDRYDDRRSDYRGRGRDDHRAPYDEPPRRRSPTPEGALPLSQYKRSKTLWDVAPAGCENMSALEAKQMGMYVPPGPARNGGFLGPQYILGPDGVPAPVHSVPGMGPGFVPRLTGGGFGGAGGGPAGPGALGGMGVARQRKRLYVGGITYDCTDANLRQLFEEKMATIGVMRDANGQGPVVDIHLSHEKSYAFIEFRTQEEATQALIFDNVPHVNTILKLRRPKDYVPDASDPSSSGAPYIPGHVSSQVPDSPNKIFIGGLPSYLNDEQVMELLKSFGELRAFNLVKENNDPDRSKGFAFCEYVDPEVTEVAIQGLNGMELGDRLLVVQRASVGSGGNAGGMRLPLPGNSANATALPVPGFAAGGGELQSRAIAMLNMVTPDELSDDADYNDIVLDITEECAKYGEVEDLLIPRPAARPKKVAGALEQAAAGAADAAKTDEERGVGKVFVLFKTVEGARAGVKAIAGRQFGGRVIICAAMDEAEFAQKRNGDAPAEDAPAPPAAPSPPRDYE